MRDGRCGGDGDAIHGETAKMRGPRAVADLRAAQPGAPVQHRVTVRSRGGNYRMMSSFYTTVGYVLASYRASLLILREYIISHGAGASGFARRTPPRVRPRTSPRRASGRRTPSRRASSSASLARFAPCGRHPRGIERRRRLSSRKFSSMYQTPLQVRRRLRARTRGGRGEPRRRRRRVSLRARA